MYCKNCGKSLNEKQNFCTNCGNKNEKLKTAINFDFLKNKKVLAVIVLVGIILVIICGIKLVKVNSPKYDPKPKWMVSSAKNPGDYSIAKNYIKEKEKEHNTKFHIMGYAYHYYNTTREYELTTIYVYSDKYPQVYVSYCVNDEHCSIDKDTYLNEIKSWEQKNLIYDIAKKLDIDTNKIAVYVGITYTENSIHGDLLVNDSIDVETIEKLLSAVKEETNSDSVSFKVYFVEKGNNKKFKDYMNGLGVADESKLDLSFGNWKKYNTIMNGSNIKLEFKWEHK